MNLHSELTDAADAGARVVAGVRPGQFGDPTPDTEWDVRTLLNHLVLWTAYNFERRAHGEMVPEEMMTRDFAAEPDFAAAYRAQLDRALDAWSDPAVWEKDLNVMGSPTPAADIASMMLAELVLHGWDLAAATGQSYTVSDRAAAAALAAVEANAEMFRQYKGFDEPVSVPDDATALDRALALSGRDPGWAPAR
jgi:uncharacterized protein (TIGR03086 family)